MFKKRTAQLLSGAFALSFFVFAPAAHARDDYYLVHFSCDTKANTVDARVISSPLSTMESGGDDLSFEWLQSMGRPLECAFSTGDAVYVKSFYGNEKSPNGDYERVSIFVNNVELDPPLLFEPGHRPSFQIRGDKNHTVYVHYETDPEKFASAAK